MKDDRTKDAAGEPSAADQPGPVHYAIRVKGHLDSRWASWFTGLRLTNENDGTTLIDGPVVDQAALHGVLQTLRDIGMPLVSLTQVRLDLSDAPITTEH
jgi:hypothetical protein